MGGDDKIININDIALEGIQNAVKLFRSVPHAVKDLPESEKILVEFQGNKTLFYAIEVVSKLLEIERNRK
jgi:hypothetical protein